MNYGVTKDHNQKTDISIRGSINCRIFMPRLKKKKKDKEAVYEILS